MNAIFRKEEIKEKVLSSTSLGTQSGNLVKKAAIKRVSKQSLQSQQKNMETHQHNQDSSLAPSLL